jgi:hypothetical protein
MWFPRTFASLEGCGRASCNRSGLTTLEFVGCVTAVIGGAWLGAIYLGLDIRKLTYVALSQSAMLDKVPADWRPKDPERSTMTREQLVETLRSELGSLRSEIVALRADGMEEAPSSARTEDQEKQATLVYWQRLNDIAVGETALQLDAETAFDETNAAKVFAVKGRISRFAAKAVEAVPTANVEPAAVQFGQQLNAWYTRGGELYERAVQIWEAPGTTQARSQLNKEWHGAELHYRNEARLMQERAAGVRGTLSRRFGDEFPEFATSPPAATAKEAVEDPAPERETTASVEP